MARLQVYIPGIILTQNEDTGKTDRAHPSIIPGFSGRRRIAYALNLKVCVLLDEIL